MNKLGNKWFFDRNKEDDILNNFRYKENNFGFFIDYIFKDKDRTKCLRLSEDDDYFSFCLFSESIDLEGTESILIDTKNPLFTPLINLLGNNNYIEILDEGSNEGITLSFVKNDSVIDLIFSLPSIPSAAATISITNVRLASPNVTFANNSPEIMDFKNKLHFSLIEIKNSLKEHLI